MTIRHFTVIVLTLGAGLAVPAVADYAAEVAADNPFAWYRLDEPDMSDGRTAADATGEHDGIFVNGVIAVPGAVGAHAASFVAGTTPRVDQPTSFNAFGSGMAGGFTIEFWIRTADTNASGSILGTLSKYTLENPNYWIMANTDVLNAYVPYRTQFYLRSGIKNCIVDHNSATAGNVDLYDGLWHHVAWVATNPSPDSLCVYVDGQIQALTAGADNDPVFSADLQYVGMIGTRNLRTNPDAGFDGALDEVAFYTNVLSAERILAH